MLEWLTGYGVNQHQFTYTELDITDKLVLQDQINAARRNWSKLVELLDDVQAKQMEAFSRQSEIVKTLTEKSVSEGTRLNQLLSLDDEYTSLEAKMKAYQAAIGIINTQMDYFKNDLRILNSVLYGKF